MSPVWQADSLPLSLQGSPPRFMCAKLLQSWPTLFGCMDWNPPGSSVQGIFQARILEWIAMPSSRGSSWPRDLTPFLHWQVGSLPLAPPWESWTLLGWVLTSSVWDWVWKEAWVAQSWPQSTGDATNAEWKGGWLEHRTSHRFCFSCNFHFATCCAGLWDNLVAWFLRLDHRKSHMTQDWLFILPESLLRWWTLNLISAGEADEKRP